MKTTGKVVLLVMLCLILFVSVYNLLFPPDAQRVKEQRDREIKKAQAVLDKLRDEEAKTDREIDLLKAALRTPDGGRAATQ